MAIKVIYLKIAIDDLFTIFKFISYDSAKYARLEVQKIKAFCETIRHNPLKGKEFKEVKENLFVVLFLETTLYFITRPKIKSIY